MSKGVQFQPGDVVIHPGRPEWGQGIVDKAAPVLYGGQTGQRLVVRFTHHGRVTINTAVAPLKPKRSEDEMTETTASELKTHHQGQGWLGSLNPRGNDPTHELWALPEAMTDLFTSPTKRLQVTLDSFRFEDGHSGQCTQRGLLDWAITQTQLTDPLAQYTRHELEQAYTRFARDRDQHLVQLIDMAKKEDSGKIVDQMIQQTPHDAARQVLKKARHR